MRRIDPTKLEEFVYVLLIPCCCALCLCYHYSGSVSVSPWSILEFRPTPVSAVDVGKESCFDLFSADIVENEVFVTCNKSKSQENESAT